MYAANRGIVYVGNFRANFGECRHHMHFGYSIDLCKETYIYQIFTNNKSSCPAKTNPSDGMEQYAYYITFFMSIVAQCFLPCYFGHELITRSEELLNCGYAGDWHQMSPRFRSMLMVFLERVKRTSVIQAGKLFPLSLETFRSVKCIFFCFLGTNY